MYECTCPQAEDICHHRAALLLHAKDNLSKTDVPCRWVRQKQSADTVTPVEDVFPASATKDVLDRPVDDDDREWFHQQLSAVNRFTGFSWLLSPEPAPLQSLLLLT